MSLNWVILAPHPPLLVPEIGGGALKDVEKTKNAMEDIFSGVKGEDIDTLVVITPHGPYLGDEISLLGSSKLEGSLARFGGSERLSFLGDFELARKISSQWENKMIPVRLLGEDEAGGEELDHSAFVPLYYYNTSLDADVKLITMTPGGVDYDLLWKAGEAMGELIENSEKRIGIIVSGDLSHRLARSAPAGFHPEAYKFDEKIEEIITKGDYTKLKEIPEKLLLQTGECGYRPLLIAGGILKGKSNSSKVFSYEGPFGVGYMVALMYHASREN